MTNLVLVWSEAKVLVCLARVLGSAEQDDIRSGWGAESELIKGQALSTSLQDAGARSGGETKSADGQLGQLQHAVVIQHSCDNCNCLAIITLLGCRILCGSNNLRQRDLLQAH